LVKKTRSCWLSRGDLKGETGSEAIAVQDLALQTKYRARRILPTATVSRCRLGQQCDKTTGHMRAQYWQKNGVLSDMLQCAERDINLREKIGVKLDNEHWYQHAPQSVHTGHSGKVTILWNQQVQTDQTIPNNKPDIKVCDNEKGTYVVGYCNVRRQKCDQQRSRKASFLRSRRALKCTDIFLSKGTDRCPVARHEQVSCCTTRRHMGRGMGYIGPVIRLTSAGDVSEWSATRAGRFNPCTHSRKCFEFV